MAGLVVAGSILHLQTVGQAASLPNPPSNAAEAGSFGYGSKVLKPLLVEVARTSASCEDPPPVLKAPRAPHVL